MNGQVERGSSSGQARATDDLAQYLLNDSGRVCFVHEPVYAWIAAGCGRACEQLGLEFESIAAEAVELPSLEATLRDHPAACLAFNRTYGGRPSASTRLLTAAARDRRSLTWTVTDVHHRFDEIFATHPDEIVHRNARLCDLAKDWRTLGVQNDAGTELEIQLSDAYDWVSIDGFGERDHDLVLDLPPGEITTCPAQVNGVIRFTGALLGRIPIGREHGLIDEPVELEIEEGRCVAVSGPECLAADIGACLAVSTHANQVVEVGLGTNPAIRSLEGRNYSFEEKHYGFHLTFGGSPVEQRTARASDHRLGLLFGDAVLAADSGVVFDGHDFLHDQLPV